MKYMCLIYFDEAKQDAMGAEAGEALKHACLDGDERLRRAGRFIAASPLQRVKTAKTVRVVRGKCLVTDGPFAETKNSSVVFHYRSRHRRGDRGRRRDPVGWLGWPRYGRLKPRWRSSDGRRCRAVGLPLMAPPRIPSCAAVGARCGPNACSKRLVAQPIDRHVFLRLIVRRRRHYRQPEVQAKLRQRPQRANEYAWEKSESRSIDPSQPLTKESPTKLMR